MLRLITVLAALFCIFLYEKKIAEGCHAGHSQKGNGDEDYDDEEGLIALGHTNTSVAGRSKRQVQQYGDDFAVLRAYFRDCMMDKVTMRWEWKSIIDFTILKTLWFLYSGTVACNEKDGKDNYVCWNECVDVYLRNTSDLIKPAKECVRQYESDFYVGKAQYASTSQKTVTVKDPPPQGKYQQCVQSQYNEVDSDSVFVDTGRRSFPAETELNVYSVVRFVRGHVRCVICDFSALPSGVRRPDLKENYEINDQEMVDGPIVYNSTWVFSFEALVRRDARLRIVIGFCNREFERTLRKDAPSNPGWTQWYTWGSCSAVCGSTGIQTRSRVCLNERERYCTGKNLEKRVCSNKNCAYWSVWGPFTQCLSTCGVSEKYSFRKCVNGKFGDEGCQGQRRRTRSCAIGSCEVSWSQWSACSVTCGFGGTQYRTGGESLLRLRTEHRPCSSPKCPEKWSPWSPWGPCSISCGNGGRRERVRRCISRKCTGESKEFNMCRKLPCKENWGQWMPWSDCGFKQRTRVCNGGSNCPGESTAYQRCPSSDCATTQHVTRPRWSEWSHWSECDSSCGPGERWRSRRCVRAMSSFGIDCVGGKSEWEHCSNTPCHLSGWGDCHDQDTWKHICRNGHMNCNGEIGKNFCKKSCGYC